MMQSLKLGSFLGFTCVVAAILPSAVVSKKLLVSVYYESYCRYSKDFIVNQLYPVYTQLSKEIQLDLIPYGGAETTMSENGTFEFTCQHGKYECHANKLHVCALTHMEMKDAMSYINCTISQHKPAFTSHSCFKSLGFEKSLASYNNLIDCVNTVEGDLLLAAGGVRTEEATPAIQGVPWIIFDNKYDADAGDKSRDDLLEVVCQHLEFKPQACREANEVFQGGLML